MGWDRDHAGHRVNNRLNSLARYYGFFRHGWLGILWVIMSSLARAQIMTPAPFLGPDSPEKTEGQLANDEDDDDELIARELAPRAKEVRQNHRLGAGVALGPVHPWLSYSMTGNMTFNPNVQAAFHLGIGNSHIMGIHKSKTFDLKMHTRSFGLSTRYYFDKFDQLSLEGGLGYVVWSGRVTPFGVDSQTDGTDNLSGSFDASGPVGFVGLGVSWYPFDHWAIDWTILGLQKSWLSGLDVTRDSPWIRSVAGRVLSGTSFYGLTAVSFVYWL